MLFKERKKWNSVVASWCVIVGGIIRNTENLLKKDERIVNMYHKYQAVMGYQHDTLLLV
jgi:hypothetical protein